MSPAFFRTMEDSDFGQMVMAEGEERGPRGPRHPHLVVADGLGIALLEACTSDKLQSVAGSRKLSNRIRSEFDSLERVDVSEKTLDSSNLPYLDALVRVASSASGLTAVLKTFWYEPSGNGQEAVHSVCVDVVCNGGSRWIKVSSRNPHAVERQFQGDERYGHSNLTTQAEALIRAAKCNMKGYHPPDVVFYFGKGVTSAVRHALLGMGAFVIGDIVNSQEASSCVKTECIPSHVSCGEYNISDVSTLLLNIPQKVEVGTRVLNLDVTTLLAYVSQLTNGSTFTDFKEEVLRLQAKEEILNPLLPILNDLMKNKELIACQSAMSAFEAIMETIGGPNEKLQAKRLRGQIKVVDDVLSVRVSHLRLSSQIKERSKTVFGTGDYARATTVTANASFVRAAAQQGIDLTVYLHAPRALTETKEAAIRQQSRGMPLLGQ